MKILIVTQYFFPENFRINIVSTYLSRQGHEITILTGLPNYPNGKFYKGFDIWSFKFRSTINDIKVIRVPIIPRFKSTSTALFVNYISFIFSACFFAPFFLRKEKYDAIFTYAPSPILQSLVGIFLKAIGYSNTLVTWIQDLWPEALFLTSHIKNQLIITIAGKVVNFIYSKNDFLLISSQDFRRPVQDRCKDKSIFYLPNPGLFDPHQPGSPEVSKIPPELLQLLEKVCFKVVYTGNIGAAQSLETVLEAAKILINNENIKFIIIGDGSKKDELRKLNAKFNLNNFFIFDSLPETDMEFINKMSSALLVTLNDNQLLNQTVPAKLQGYLSSKRPIIGAVGGVASSIITMAKCGFVSSPGDPTLLAHNIEKLSKLTQLELDEFGSNGYKYYVENFNPNLIAKQLSDILKNNSILIGD
ncbi:Glycosyltransferase [Polynucleobacter duraquae]|uniref:Glycosyltransferase n=1 Tax=Polynucleobacter duraquae TaxID=1835254 RepID=A0A0E3ZIU6_9BURK|nr:glycosyltransferase family 4 protein [Polynucleobacter duraquae]AKD24667.1 Glycosyltransferase [Polynucleobacter duraquae]